MDKLPLLYRARKNQFARWCYPVYREGHPEYDRIYHVHIRKCAGTSLNRAFLRYLAPKRDAYKEITEKPDGRIWLAGRPVVGFRAWPIKRGAFWYAFSHLPYHSLPLPERTFTFTFLRDPVARVLSHYNMLCDLSVTNPEHPGLRLEGAWIRHGFEGFLECIPDNQLLAQLYMFDGDGDIDAALRRISSVNFVGMIEDIEGKFLPLVKQRLSIDLPYEWARRSVSSFQPCEPTLTRLRERLRMEYAFISKVREAMDLGNWPNGENHLL